MKPEETFGLCVSRKRSRLVSQTPSPPLRMPELLSFFSLPALFPFLSASCILSLCVRGSSREKKSHWCEKFEFYALAGSSSCLHWPGLFWVTGTPAHNDDVSSTCEWNSYYGTRAVKKKRLYHLVSRTYYENNNGHSGIIETNDDPALSPGVLMSRLLTVLREKESNAEPVAKLTRHDMDSVFHGIGGKSCLLDDKVEKSLTRPAFVLPPGAREGGMAGYRFRISARRRATSESAFLVNSRRTSELTRRSFPVCFSRVYSRDVMDIVPFVPSIERFMICT